MQSRHDGLLFAEHCKSMKRPSRTTVILLLVVVLILCVRLALYVLLSPPGTIRLPFFSADTSRHTYFISVSGHDHNSGLSPAFPWKTMERVNVGFYRGGDSILFERGGVWWEELQPTCSGLPGAPIVYGAYGIGSRPRIDAGGRLEGWNVPENWKEAAPNIWGFNVDRYPGRLWLSGREYGASGTTTGKGSTTPNERYRWWVSNNEILEVYSSGNPATSYSSVDVADEGRCAMTVNDQSWLSFVGLEFRRGSTCIDVWRSHHLVFDACSVLGGTAQYGLWLRGGSDDGEIRNCVLDREDTVMHTFPFGGTGGNGNGQDNIALQSASRWEIHHNMIVDPGHDAILMSGEKSSDGIYRSCNNTVHHNEVTMSGDYGLFVLIYAKDDLSYCSNNEVYGNYVHHMTLQSQILGRHNFLHDNVFEEYRVIPYDTLHERSCVIELSDYLDPAGEDNRIWNNVFLNCDAQALSLKPGARRVSVRNNIIVNTGRLLNASGHDFLNNVGIVLWPGASGDTVVNNVFWTPGGLPVVYQGAAWSQNMKTSPEWLNMQDGDHGNVLRGNVSQDPELDGDFRPRATRKLDAIGLHEGMTVGISKSTRAPH